jgi:hypothetical protein
LPINIFVEKAQHLGRVFECHVGTYPFTYLGPPMGTTKPRVEDHTTLVSKIEKRIIDITTWLTTAGTATLVDMMVSSVPIYIVQHQDASVKHNLNRQSKKA